MKSTVFAASLVGIAAIASVSAGESKFRRIELDLNFRSEGVAVADINRDGKNDVVVGDLWYAAPDWTAQEIRKPRPPNRGGYTDAFAVYTRDYNKDGWTDVLVIPFHGKDAIWYENPQGKPGHWPSHLAMRKTGNETRLEVDLFGDGDAVYLMGIEHQLSWVSVPDDPTEVWHVHPIADSSLGDLGAKKYYHGLGVGDVNRDGRRDVIIADGWFEQPQAGRKAEGSWQFHSGKISNACADMHVFDADGDGRNDIFSTSAHGYGVWWHRQAKPGADKPFETHELDRSIKETHALNVVDIDGDGQRELVTGWRFFAHGFKPEKADMPSELAYYDIETAEGKPPKLTKHIIDMRSGVGAQFLTADYNGDNLIDVIVSNRKGVFIFEQLPRR